MNRLTVLMAVHNGERFVREAIDSILAQDFGDFAFHIIDDASADGTGDVLSHYARADSRVRVVRYDTNRGLGACLAEGTLSCQSEWIARMDADDVSASNRFSRQFEFLREHPELDVFGTWVEEIDEAGRSLGVRRYPTDEASIKRTVWTNPFKHSSVFLRKSALLRVGSYNPLLRKRQDYELWFRCVAGGLRLANLGEPLTKYRFSADYFQRNNLRVSWDSVKIGWKGCWRVRASPLAWVGVTKPLWVSLVPPEIRPRLYRFLYRFDPRHK